MFGICNLAIIPLRFEPSDRSEIVSQLLFGEHFMILEKLNQWFHIQLEFDGYQGWIDSKQCQLITQNQYEILGQQPLVLNADLIEYITNPQNILIPVPSCTILYVLYV